MHNYPLSTRLLAEALEFRAKRLSHRQSSLPTIGERPWLDDASMGPISAGQMDMALGSHLGPSTPTLQGQQIIVG